MNDSAAAPEPRANSAQTLLHLRSIGDIQGKFFIPRYQRGYRWGPTEVRLLLNDIWKTGRLAIACSP